MTTIDISVNSEGYKEGTSVVLRSTVPYRTSTVVPYRFKVVQYSMDFYVRACARDACTACYVKPCRNFRMIKKMMTFLSIKTMGNRNFKEGFRSETRLSFILWHHQTTSSCVPYHIILYICMHQKFSGAFMKRP